MKPVVLADLDGTLIHSRRRVADEDVPGLVVVEVYDGRDVGFMTPTGWELLADLQRTSHLVPATARTVRQYSRIRFPEQPAVALVAGGGVILVDGEPDPTWAALTEQVIAATGTSASQVAERMRDLPVTEEPRVGDDRFAFVRVADGADTDDFEHWCQDRGWRMVRQDGRLYALAGDLSKQRAVARITELLGARPAVALGDGMMDLEMMTAAALALTPEHSPLWRSGWRNGEAVAGAGPTGTEALLRATLDHLNPTLPGSAAPREENHVR